jgi:hypothetical protein
MVETINIHERQCIHKHIYYSPQIASTKPHFVLTSHRRRSVYMANGKLLCSFLKCLIKMIYLPVQLCKVLIYDTADVC